MSPSQEHSTFCDKQASKPADCNAQYGTFCLPDDQVASYFAVIVSLPPSSFLYCSSSNRLYPRCCGESEYVKSIDITIWSYVRWMANLSRYYGCNAPFAACLRNGNILVYYGDNVLSLLSNKC